MAEIAIHIEHLTKTFLKREEKSGAFSRSKDFITALNNISFDIYTGESVGLIGRNGSGKSTLLKILGGIYSATSGRYSLKSKPILILDSGLGFHKDLSGYDNIIFYGRILGLTIKEVKKKIDEIADFAEIKDFLYIPVKHYSNGMISRLTFSVIPFLKGDIFLIDEVLAFGDLSFQRKALNFLKELNTKGKTFLVVSHQLNNLISLCNRFIVLQNGKFINDGPPLKILPEYYEELLLSKYQDKDSFVQTNIEKLDVINFNIPFEMNGLYIYSAKIIPSKHGTNEFESSEEICIEFTCKSIKKQNTVDFGIIVRDILQNIVFSLSLAQKGIIIENSNNKKFKIKLNIQTKVLNNGLFFVYPFLFNNKTKDYKTANKSLAFKIISENSKINETVKLMSLLGPVKVPASWEIVS